MRMRSVLAASVLATGILLGGAGGAMAHGGGGGGSYNGEHGGQRSDTTTFAGVIHRVGPVFYQNDGSETVWSRESALGFFS